MVLGMVFLAVLALLALGSVGLVVREVVAMHRRRESLTDQPGDAAGVSAAGMVFMGNSFTH